MLNSVTLMGRLTADPEVRVATTGKQICRFRIAIDRPGGDKVADFINIICFGHTADFVGKYFRKGSMIGIQGKIQTGSYTDNKGAKRYSFEVAANEVSFCGGKTTPSVSRADSSLNEGAKSSDEGTNGYYSNAVPSDFDEITDDDEDVDLPY